MNSKSFCHIPVLIYKITLKMKSFFYLTMGSLIECSVAMLKGYITSSLVTEDIHDENPHYESPPPKDAETRTWVSGCCLGE